MEANNPTVSVIIPTYNRIKYISRAINSVINQTFRDYEIIVVDDASTDGTVKFIRENYPNITLVQLSKNSGAGAARNQALSIAKGNFIAFLDSDDQWEKNYLETQIHYIQSDSNNVLAFCGCIHQKQDRTIVKFNCKPWLPYPNLVYHLLSENFILTSSSVVVRSETLKESGKFNETLKIGEDKELFLRLLCLGKATHVPHYLVTKYSHESNLTRNYQLWVKETFNLLDVFFDNDLSKPYKHFEVETRSHNAMRLARILWYEKRQPLFALQMFFKAFSISPQYISQHFWKKVTHKLNKNSGL
ncbi:glycosyltransferase family 2 protein [Aetokthonos hydrillicola Thurmond2011]|jgi:glycosyltransferase involved in cell wall biosynthesis|uniref:Glycosyltransferase family 2 protein n=1 Tax=Aetokthonos hydrillicola Thurmond2011 TaxID=2712845 RepID=A0AAP5I4D1_9CYAN|nr:glycosyltransferase family A protein [Aetokthonos hydrillicola]MBO3463540.1 glycosyltransferase family 2 protein [Aetokthonos hydrillicola CCALA 1050]MBW4590262.1 glycosyltransferase family 2 protein [Aetokthonos hydrillicola CCALA 1050]MDR9894832.1 glycosyltransferase family 2 protein [Aetokthonos hydrillicola Thurmond2011]